MTADIGLHVAMCDRATSYRRGLGAVLTAAGYVVEDMEDVRTHPLADCVAALLLTVRLSNDWQVLRKVSAENGDLMDVALLVDATPDRHAEAL